MLGDQTPALGKTAPRGPEKAMAPHSSTLAWKIPWTEEPAKSPTRLSDITFTFHFHAMEKEMATHSSVLAWRVPGTEEPSKLPSMGSHRVRYDWHDLAAAAAAPRGHRAWSSGWDPVSLCVWSNVTPVLDKRSRDSANSFIAFHENYYHWNYL